MHRRTTESVLRSHFAPPPAARASTHQHELEARLLAGFGSGGGGLGPRSSRRLAFGLCLGTALAIAGACQIPSTYALTVGREVHLEVGRSAFDERLLEALVEQLERSGDAREVSVRVLMRAKESEGEDTVDVTLRVWGEDVPDNVVGRLRSSSPWLEGAVITERELSGPYAGTLGSRLRHELFHARSGDVEAIRRSILERIAAETGHDAKVDVRVDAPAGGDRVRVRAVVRVDGGVPPDIESLFDGAQEAGSQPAGPSEARPSPRSESEP